jgi:hypothetical protein
LIKLLKKIGGWRGKLLNVRSKLILIQSCIASILVHLLAVIKFPKWALNMINSQMFNFLWDDTKDGRKYYLANWDLVCLKKEFSGLGVQNLRDYNLLQEETATPTATCRWVSLKTPSGQPNPTAFS